MKKHLILLIVVVFFSYSYAFSQIQVGTGSEINKGLPMEPAMSYNYSQVIYLSSEINDGDGGTVTQLKWYFNGNDLSNSNNWTIYIGHTTKTSFTSTTDWIAVSSLTQVWSSTFASPSGAGWITFDIADWNYNGTDNIVVAVDENSSGDNAATNDFYCSSISDYRALLYSHIYNPDPASPPEATARRAMIANIIFEGLSDCCPIPSNQLESNITSNSVVLDWTENGSATQWQIQYGPEGFSLGNGTVITITTKPYTLTGLNPDVAYDWYIKANCGSCNSSYSEWSTFWTECSTKTAPWSDNFEAHQTTTSGIWGNCWRNEPFNTISLYTWDLDGNGSTPSSYTGPSKAHSGSKYGYTEASSGSGGDITELFSPYIDLSALTNPSVSFFYHMYGTGMGNLHVDVYNGTSWTNDLLIINGQQQTSASEPWYQKMINLSAFSGNTVKIRFRGEKGTSGNNYFGDISIDDFNVDEYTCSAPSTLSTSSITSNSAQLTWSENGSASSWQIEYGLSGFTPGNGTIITTGSNPYTLTSLSGSSTYDWYIQASCGSGNYSSRIGPQTFTTSVGYQTLPLTESFENEYQYFDNIGTNTTFFNMESSLQYHGNMSVHDAYANASTDILEETGMLDLTSVNNPILKFRHIAKTEGSYDKCYIEISTDGGTNYNVLPTSTYFGESGNYGSKEYFDENSYTTWGSNDTPDNSWWKMEIFELKNYKTNKVRIRFRLNSDGSIIRNGWYIDDIRIYDYQCTTPTALTENGIDFLKADLFWTDDITDKWNLRLVTHDTDTAGKPFTILSNKQVSVDTLLGGTAYDWYVRSACYSGTYTGWSNKRTFQTESIPSSAISSFPYTQSFENDLGNWQQFDYDNFDFSRQIGSTPTTNTGPSSAFDGSYYLYTESTDNNPSKSVNIVNKFDFSTLSVPQLSFYYNMSGYYMGTLKVLITTDNGANYTELWTMTGDRESDWHEKVLYLKNYGGNNNVIIKITAITGEETSDMAFDKIDVREAPACLPPEEQTENNFTSSSADLNWTENGSATSWEIEYGNEGFTPGTGTTISVTAKPYTLGSLAINMQYDWYVCAVCSGSNKSGWAGPHTFFTSPSVVGTPYFENFDEVSTPSFPSGMRTSNRNDDYILWKTSTNSPFSGNNSVSITANGMLDMDDWFFTRGITLTGGIEYELGFMYLSGWDEEIEIKYGNDASPTAMTHIINNSITEASAGYEFRYDSFTPSSTGTYYIGFHGTTLSDGDNINIDDLYVTVLNTGSVTWNGSVDENWWNKNNWVDDNPPSSYADVKIPPGRSFYPNITQLAPANTFIVQSDITGTGSIIFSENKYLQLAFDETPNFQQYIAKWTSSLHGWHHISSPVQDQDIQPTFISNPPSSNEDLYHWDEANNIWINCKTSQGNWNSSFESSFQLGKGYLTAFATNKTVTFTGDPNYQDITIDNLSYTSSLSSPGWHLLGNPFPSAIFWNKTNWDLSNVDATAKIWKESTASYIDIQAGTGIIPAMQGVMVHVNAAPGSLIFDASDRTNQTAVWLKDNPSNQIKLTVFDILGGTAQESVIKVFPQATSGFDSEYDAEFLSGYAPQFYSISDGVKLSTNTLPDITESSTITLGFIKNESANYYMKAEFINDFIPETRIYLLDNKTGKSQLLNQNPDYYFTASEGDLEQRFLLQFRPLGLSDRDELNPLTAFDSRGNIIINTESSITATVFIYDLSGRLLTQASMYETNSIKINMNGFSGIAIIKVVNTKHIYTTKVFIQ